MRSFRRISKPSVALAAALMLAVVAGCDPVTGPENQMNAARSRWEKQGLDDYTFRYRRLCFCPSESTRLVIVTVRQDTVAEVVYADTRQPVPANMFREYRTIDGLFGVIQDAVNRGADKINVTYDPARGYPTNAAFDYEKDATDDEITFTVDSVEALP
jgi:hypothetical protein